VIRTVLASLTAAALLALVPAAALAQDSGSQQYQDPLAGDNPNPTPRSTGNGSSPGNTQNTTAQTQAAQTGSTNSASRNELPRTGLDAWLLLLAGTALLGGGLALRRAADQTRT